MAKPKLDLYLDVVSPFAYLAFYLVHVSNNHLLARQWKPSRYNCDYCVQYLISIHSQ